MSITVLRSGFFTTVQDLGRTGFRDIGVSLGGALDTHALRAANLLVGNDPSAAGLETTLARVRLRFDDDRVIAWCGGSLDVQLPSAPLPPGRSASVKAGDELTITAPERGARGWLAISGGIDVPLVMGSRSTDLRAQFGGFEGRALRDGDVLALGKSRVPPCEGVASWGAPAEWSQSGRRRAFLRVVRGSEWDAFDVDAHLAFIGAQFEVAEQTDRMGARLSGPPLQRDDQQDLISAPVAPGTIQVPPNGQPILLLGDCQTIGGYPKIAHVITVDMAIAAQLRPGDPVRFSMVSVEQARALLRERERDVAWFAAGVGLRNR
jgi:antagonist of KipI